LSRLAIISGERLAGPSVARILTFRFRRRILDGSGLVTGYLFSIPRRLCQSASQNPRTKTMSCTEDSPHDPADPLEMLDDRVAAAAFRRLVRHLRHRHDAQNIDLMGLSGFCRNCLADWIRDAGFAGDKAAARALIHGMPADEWKVLHQTEATPGQIARMEASMKKNGPAH